MARGLLGRLVYGIAERIWKVVKTVARVVKKVASFVVHHLPEIAAAIAITGLVFPKAAWWTAKKAVTGAVVPAVTSVARGFLWAARVSAKGALYDAIHMPWLPASIRYKLGVLHGHK